MRRGPLPRQAQQPVAMASFSSLRRRRSPRIASELRGALPEGQSPSPSPSPSPVGFHGRSVSVPEQKPDAAVVDGPTSKSNPAVPHWERTTPAYGGCELRRRRRGSRSKDAIGGGLRESPALGRPMACAGDGVLATPRGGRCLGYRPGGRYLNPRPPPGCLVAVRSGMCGPDQESLLFIFLVQTWTPTGTPASAQVRERQPCRSSSSPDRSSAGGRPRSLLPLAMPTLRR